MADENSFKRKEHRKQPVVLTTDQLQRLIANSQLLDYEKEKEEAKIRERKKRQAETREITDKVIHRKEPGSELRAKQYEMDVKNVHQDLKTDAATEARRNFVLDLAYKRLFEETDKVKNFKAAKNFAQMMKDRADQIEAKASVNYSFAEYDAKYTIGMLRDTERFAEENRGKLEREKQVKLKNAENWEKQRNHVYEKALRDKWEHLRDGYLVRDAAENYEKEAQKKMEKAKLIEQNHKNDLDAQIKKKQAIFEMNDKLDEAEEKRRKLFNDAKQEMKLVHQQVKAELDKKKDGLRQYVAETLADENCKIKSKEEAILQKAVLEKEAKRKEELALKQLEKDEAQASIRRFYENVLDRKAERKREDRRNNFREGRQIIDKVEELMKIEDSKAAKSKNLKDESQHFQMHQIAKKEEVKKMEEMEKVRDYMAHMRSLDEEEDFFQKYAQAEIAKCEARGLDVRPMKVAAKVGIECGKGPLYKDRGQIRPKYYAAVDNPDDLPHIKRSEKRIDTKLRLGFMLP